MRTTKKERKTWRGSKWAIETDDFERLLNDADAFDTVAAAVGLRAEASAEDVVARVKSLVKGASRD